MGAAFAFRHALGAWWADDAGNRALLEGRSGAALVWFDRGLSDEPKWALLHEDRGRALLPGEPAQALGEFERAHCGPPCLAEAGDALVRLGRADEAVERYIQADATPRASEVAMQMARAGDFDRALRVERSLASHLHDNFMERSDLASAYATIGKIQTLLARAPGPMPGKHRHGLQALSAFASASRLAPLNEDYLLSYGFSELQWGSVAAARNTFQRLLRLHPGQPDATKALAATKSHKRLP